MKISERGTPEDEMPAPTSDSFSVREERRQEEEWERVVSLWGGREITGEGVRYIKAPAPPQTVRISLLRFWRLDRGDSQSMCLYPAFNAASTAFATSPGPAVEPEVSQLFIAHSLGDLVEAYLAMFPDLSTDEIRIS